MNNPNTDFGFYAAIPRIVRTEHKTLTPAQKWLYVCLKDLCGDHGTCYRSLRSLSEETGMSTGMLSESIPALHEAGLIHAEKKRRQNKPTAKEVWHITIVDIWQANGKAHPTKRSQNEESPEDRSQNEQDPPQNVHKMNDNVHKMNVLGAKRSQNEQKRSQNERGQSSERALQAAPDRQNGAGRKNREERTVIEERPMKERETLPPQPSPAPGSFPSLSLENPLLSSLTEEEAAFWSRWCGVATAPYNSLNQTAYEHVIELAPERLSTSDLQDLYEETYNHLRLIATAKGTKLLPPRLGNLVKFLPEWRKTRERRKQEERESREEREFIPGTGGIRNFTTERLRGKIERLDYAPQPTQRRDRGMPTPTIDAIPFTDRLAKFRQKYHPPTLAEGQVSP